MALARDTAVANEDRVVGRPDDVRAGWARLEAWCAHGGWVGAIVWKHEGSTGPLWALPVGPDFMDRSALYRALDSDDAAYLGWTRRIAARGIAVQLGAHYDEV